MVLVIPDHKIEVQYYLVEPDSDLYRSMDNYWQKAEAFAQKAEDLVRRVGADSAIRTHSFNISVGGVNFLYDKVPLTGWERETFGYYQPKNQEIQEAFRAASMPYFSRSPEYKNILPDTRFGKLGDIIIAACTMNKDGSTPNMPDAMPITPDEVEHYKAAAPVEDAETFRLDNYYWIAGPLLRSAAFKPSDAMREELQEATENFMFPSRAYRFKYSTLGRIVHRLTLGGQAEPAVA